MGSVEPGCNIAKRAETCAEGAGAVTGNSAFDAGSTRCEDAANGHAMLQVPDQKHRIEGSHALGSLVRERRRARGWGLEETARRAGVKRDFVKTVECRVLQTFDAGDLLALLRVLEIGEIPQDDPEEILAPQLWRAREGVEYIDLPRNRCQLLRRRRLELGLKQSEVAVRANVYTSWLTMIENDNVDSADAVRMARLASALDIRAGTANGNWLLGDLVWIGPYPLVMKNGRQTSAVDWDQQPLGQLSDVELAEQMGLPTRTVWRARNRAGIPPWKGPTRAFGTVTQRLWPPFTAEELEEKVGPAPVQGDEIHWEKVPLGCTTDRALAAWLRCKRERVQYARRRRNIPPCPGRVLWENLPLGRVPDTVIADWIGTSSGAVCSQRKTRGIPPAPPETRGVFLNYRKLFDFSTFTRTFELRFPPPLPKPQPRLRTIPVRTPRMDPPAKKGDCVWDHVEAAVEFIEEHEQITVLQVMKFLGFRSNASRKVREVTELLHDLGWVLKDGVWHQDAPGPERLAPPLPTSLSLPEVMQEGLWTLKELVVATTRETEAVRKELGDLLDSGDVQRIGHGSATRYLLTNTSNTEDEP